MLEEERHQAQRGHGGGHHYRTKAQTCALANRLCVAQSTVAQLADVGDEHYTVEHGDASGRTVMMSAAKRTE